MEPEPDEGPLADAHLTPLNKGAPTGHDDPETIQKTPENYGFDFKLFSETPHRKREWIWEGVIPKGCTSVIAGKQGRGKSFVDCDLAARVSTGREMPDGVPVPQGNVLMFVREDDPEIELQDRLIAAGADRSRIYCSEFIDPIKGTQLQIEEKIEKLTEFVIDFKIVFVVVDTYSAFADTESDANSAQAVRALLNPLNRLARATGAAVLIICHERKSGYGTGDPMDAIAGSLQMTAAVRVASLLEEGKTKNSRRLRVVKSNFKNSNDLGWVYHFDYMGPDGEIMETPHLVWETADESYRAKDADRRDNRTTLDLEVVMEALQQAVAASPIKMNLACKKVADALRARVVGKVAQKDVPLAVEELLQSDQDEVELYFGPRNTKMLCLKGQRPPTPEEMAYRIAEIDSNMSGMDLAKKAGCRPKTAYAVLKEIKSMREPKL